MLLNLLNKNPGARIKVDDALLHPWILERVKIRSAKEKFSLYPIISEEQKKRSNDLIESILIKGGEFTISI